jgi:hypothetical protein
MTIGHKVHQRSELHSVASKCCDVGKNNGKWQMCTDFTDLKKCYPKDDFPLAIFVKIVDSIAGCEIMVLLDYFLGYH